MLQQAPYRKKLKVGDVFRLAYPGDVFVFGKIMSLTAKAGGFDDCIKIYVYDFISKDEVAPDEIGKLNLMFEPLFINRLGFSRGYMPVVANQPVSATESKSGWCFCDVVFKKYFDEGGDEVSEPTDLVGTWGLSNYLMLDDHVSQKLGFEAIEDAASFT